MPDEFADFQVSLKMRVTRGENRSILKLLSNLLVRSLLVEQVIFVDWFLFKLLFLHFFAGFNCALI
jgi:hypothetical protein